MQMSFRWYGPDDPVTLRNIRQIPGVVGIVTSLYHLSAGEAWPEDEIRSLVRTVEAAGLRLTVIESVPVHEDIKLGRPTRDRYIANYQTTLRRLAAAGVRTVCYNFMPLFDWLRTSLTYELPDGSTTLAYFDEEVDEQALLAGRLRLRHGTWRRIVSVCATCFRSIARWAPPPCGIISRIFCRPLYRSRKK
ncbi:hypothetical protein GCM10025858_10170 [Alicyclobacillus sacchari]|nr:hypothetical protein GCM10025858_10170 [Alicyclobacillus sacchari]